MRTRPPHVYFGRFSTWVLMQQLARALQVGGPPVVRGYFLGAEASLYDQVWAVVADVSRLLDDAAQYPGDFLRRELERYFLLCKTLYFQAIDEGYTLAAQIIDEISKRIADAIATLGEGVGKGIEGVAKGAGAGWAHMGEGAGQAFKNFWGLKPGEAARKTSNFFGFFALVAIGGGLYVVSTAGGQSYLVSMGRGAGSAVASYGRGIEGFAKGLPAVLPWK